uniref:T-complex protein 1 subunit beta n=1 Tax=Cyprinus carpio TaxID=7962 RepID=A0A8C1W672_CYPCA
MASLSMTPMNIFRHGADEEKAETARMDKILLGGGRDSVVTVTNDGATILKAIGVDNPAAKVLVDMSKVQDDEVGDGTTSVTVLAAELLREAELLIAKKIHPQIIIAGWRKATQAAREALRDAAVDNGNDELKFQQDLMNIARTTLSSKLVTHHKEHFSKLAVQAVHRLKGSGNLEAIHIIKKLGGSLTDSYLDEGFLLDKRIGVNQPKRIENANILIANTGMDTDKIKIFGSRVRVDSTAKVAEIETAEKEKMKEKVERILKHGINCFINRQLIYNYPEQLFASAGVMAIEHADFMGVERLALVTGGEITSTFDHPELVKLGHCKLIEEVMIGEDMLIHFSGVDMGEACTIVLRGATQQILDEAERSLHDALCVLAQTIKETRTVFGGGEDASGCLTHTLPLTHSSLTYITQSLSLTLSYSSHSHTHHSLSHTLSQTLITLSHSSLTLITLSLTHTHSSHSQTHRSHSSSSLTLITHSHILSLSHTLITHSQTHRSHSTHSHHSLSLTHSHSSLPLSHTLTLITHSHIHSHHSLSHSSLTSSLTLTLITHSHHSLSHTLSHSSLPLTLITHSHHSLSLTHSHSSLTLTFTHSLTHSHTHHSLSQSFTLSHSHHSHSSLTLTFTHSLSHTHTHSHTHHTHTHHSLSHSFTLSHTHHSHSSLTLTFTHSHTHTLTHTLITLSHSSLTLTFTHSLSHTRHTLTHTHTMSVFQAAPRC